jgi:hypothetical protein
LERIGWGGQANNISNSVFIAGSRSALTVPMTLWNAARAAENPAMAFMSLNHYLDAEWLRYAYECTRKDGAVGVDGQTAQEYAAD